MNVNLPTGKQVQVTVPQGMSAGMKMTINYNGNSSAAAPPQQPSYAPIVPQAPQMHTEKRTVEIEIPHGVKAGNQITVNLPNGKTVKVTVPNGMHAGNKLTINYDMDVPSGAAQQPAVPQPV